MSDQVFTILDYETVSEADLRKVGAYEYARHPSTKILCVAWRTGTRETLRKSKIQSWSPALSKGIPRDFCLALNQDHLVAHNAFFEQVITRFVLPRHARPEQLGLVSWPAPFPHRWTDTAALAATHALPRKLEDVCPALELPYQKDMSGHRLMLKMSKPRKPSKNNPSKWHRKLSDLGRLIQYCESDIAAETELFLRLPPLSPFERKIWELDQTINWRGVGVDRELVDAAIVMRDTVSHSLKVEALGITGGISPTQRDALLRWLSSNGCQLPDLKEKTISGALALNAKKPSIAARPLRVLEIRQDLGKSSTKKYDAFTERTSDDDRIRGSLVYHAASTGRWAGAGVQPQNFPRGAKGIDALYAAELVREGDLPMVRLLYGSPMEALAATLRPCFVAAPGHRLVAGDFNAIELRVLFWVSDHAGGLKALVDNRQMYREMGEVIFDVKLPKDEGPEREVGKRAILGCGFGMGWSKFMATCEQFGSPVSAEIAKKAVNAYRSFHHPVPKLWKNLEIAAIHAVQNPGKVFAINHTKWYVRGKFLYCELPSGRVLPYMHPSIKHEEAPWGGDMLPKLYHYGVNPRTKKWGRDATWGGVLTENVIQATARDLMAYAMPRLEDAGYKIVLTVHDEVITEAPLGHGSVKEFESIMAATPAWAKGCPVKVKAFESPRYKK